MIVKNLKKQFIKWINVMNNFGGKSLYDVHIREKFLNLVTHRYRGMQALTFQIQICANAFF